ncbi:NAD-dependent epimerase [Echinimonas agarilytica]|uniref:NAD-dependent epimerase n=1 Tax=Echinimonas agarilytica TaxID=1215918 RepID=A0AA41W5Y2_9GAMM|nr:NAD-dependent epimerase [Echinimonas agarilytica]MCM2679684.1 NAD-dependent epimerase [Echinimonas agarilytica]
MKILVTGAAGFIGFHLSKRLCESGIEVVGIDNLNNYYDVQLKLDRLAILEPLESFRFIKLDLADREGMAQLFETEKFDRVIHLAAQAGVRHSLKAPFEYVDSNLTGMMSILEGCRHSKVQHLVFASSSSVYGMNESMPFTTDDNVDHPVSLYAASKKANELMAHSYAHLYGLPTTGLRFFTVYGPWGRPDMAYFLFTDAMLAGKPIKVFNHGKMRRDFTYIDDIVEGILRVADKVPQPNPDWASAAPSASKAPYKIYNIGNNEPEELGVFISTLEKHLGIEAEKEMLPMQAGDVPATAANIDDLVRDVGFSPSTTIDKGLGEFVKWYKSYYS